MAMTEIEIRQMTTIAEIQKVEGVQQAIWDSTDLEILPFHSLHALAKNGAALYGAYDEDKLIGFVLGVLATVDTPERIDQVAAARLKMYSVMAGVLREYQGQGVGYRLKLAQREFALRIGVRLITWTYDPLESLNARLNLGKLGVICHRYLRHFHGEMTGINAGLPTDRFEAEWWVTSNRVEGRVVKQRPSLSLDALQGGGALLINETFFDESGLSVPPTDYVHEPPSNLVLVEIPADYQTIKRQDFDLALRWRQHSRQLFEEYFINHYMVTDFVYDRGPDGKNRSFYLLTHKDA